jgi:hypothetical protein
MSGSGSVKKKGSGIKRDADRQSVVAADPALATAGKGETEKRGHHGTFGGFATSQLGIGPEMGPLEQTAANTARMADGIETLVQSSGAQQGMAAATPTVASGVAARGDDEMVSIAERTAVACERSLAYLRQLAGAGAPQAAGAFV